MAEGKTKRGTKAATGDLPYLEKAGYRPLDVIPAQPRTWAQHILTEFLDQASDVVELPFDSASMTSAKKTALEKELKNDLFDFEGKVEIIRQGNFIYLKKI